MASVPCPSASGAQVKTRIPEINPPTAGTKTTSHQGLRIADRMGRVFARWWQMEVKQSCQNSAVHELKRLAGSRPLQAPRLLRPAGCKGQRGRPAVLTRGRPGDRPRHESRRRSCRISREQGLSSFASQCGSSPAEPCLNAVSRMKAASAGSVSDPIVQTPIRADLRFGV